MVETQ
jgi:hypothetical protein